MIKIILCCTVSLDIIKCITKESINVLNIQYIATSNPLKQKHRTKHTKTQRIMKHVFTILHSS